MCQYIYIYIYLYIMYIYIYYIHIIIYIHITHIYIYIYQYHIYIWSPPTAPRHVVCTVIYNITCSFFMFTFCGYLYIFIRTSSYKQKHNNILILFGEDPWQRINKLIEPTKHMWRLFGEGSLEKTKKNKKTNKLKNKTKKTEETKPIGDPAIPMVLFFFCFGGG